MGIKHNVIRERLDKGLTTVATRMWSSNPFFFEILGDFQFDYVEFLAEYSPYTLYDFQNMCRAAELNGMGSLIKIDFQSRGYFAQKAAASGFQGILFTDHRTADEVKESIRMITPETEEDGGIFGYPNNRFIGCQDHISQMDHAKRVRDIVKAFMIEKKEAMDNIEAICEVPGVDMVQFGPSDFSLSSNRNLSAFRSEAKEAEKRMIKVAIKNKVRPRCEISCADDAKYYADLGVRDFCLGDQLVILKNFWKEQGNLMAELCKGLQ